MYVRVPIPQSTGMLCRCETVIFSYALFSLRRVALGRRHQALVFSESVTTNSTNIRWLTGLPLQCRIPDILNARSENHLFILCFDVRLETHTNNTTSGSPAAKSTRQLRQLYRHVSIPVVRQRVNRAHSYVHEHTCLSLFVLHPLHIL